MNNQLMMEEEIKKIFKAAQKTQAGKIVGMMKPYFVRCDFDEKSLTVGFDIEEWELNPQNIMHGGMICTAFDNVFGTLTHFFSGESFITTVEISVHYHKPVFVGDKIEITVKPTHAGRTIVGFTGELRVANRQMLLCATSSTTYMKLAGKKTALYKDDGK
ncbi:PaaI family thioesterase [Lachnospiraceae bacterium NSJ-143]|nr:PaaI family thioesterase [Lachnospiraceae bacterium NSJ-143]